MSSIALRTSSKRPALVASSSPTEASGVLGGTGIAPADNPVDFSTAWTVGTTGKARGISLEERTMRGRDDITESEDSTTNPSFKSGTLVEALDEGKGHGIEVETKSDNLRLLEKNFAPETGI